MGLLHRLIDWIELHLPPSRPALGNPRPVRMPTVPPPVKAPPNSVVLYYRGAANHEVVREAFALGQWCGEHNISSVVVAPGDGTLRLEFENETDVLMFSLTWNELIRFRQPYHRIGNTGPR